MLSTNDIERALMRSPVLEDVPDSRDYQLEEIVGVVNLPETYSLRDNQSPVKNQGGRGTCSAHAAAAVAEYFNNISDLSEEYLFKRTKEIDKEDYGFEGYGAYMRSAVKALTEYGTCLESLLPYDGTESEDFWKEITLTEEQNRNAERYRTESYASVKRNVEAIKTALYTTQAPLLAGFNLYESYRESKTDGYFPVPKKGEKFIGGHAMSIVGYNRSYFILKNSWGDWGDDGYCYWPFASLSYMFSIWSFIDLLDEEQLNKIKMEENAKQVPTWAYEAWSKATKKGLVTPETKPNVQMTKAEFFVFLERLRLI